MRRTPATRAGTAAITSDDGSGNVPLGTQMPTESSGSQRRSETIPGCCLDGGVARPLRLAERPHGADHRAQCLEHVGVDLRAAIASAGTRKPVRAGAVEALRPLEHRLVTALAHVGDDRRDDGDRVVEPCSPHGTSRSIGRTRIEVAPASRSAGSSDQTSSAATAA